MKSWSRMYISALRMDVKKELEARSDLQKVLGRYEDKFVRWCAGQRVIYEADLDDEVSEFYQKFVATRLYNVDVKLWKRVRMEVFERDQFTCTYCGKRGGRLEVDHVVPISKGGTNDLGNLVTSCRKCNRQKKDKSLEEFIKWSESQ